MPLLSASRSRLYQCVVVGLFLTLMGVVMGLASPGLSDTDLDVVSSSVHIPVVVASTFFYGFVLLRLFSVGGRLMAQRATLLAFMPLTLFCVLSSIWSVDPALTLRRAGFLLLSVLVGMILGSDFTVEQLASFWAIASLIHIALCLVFFVISSSSLYSPSDPTALKGLTTHKNIFGFEQGLACIVFLLVPFTRFKVLRFGAAAVAGILLLLSHSSGSLVATLCGIALLPVLFFLSKRGIHNVVALLVCGALTLGVTVLLFQNASLIPALFSKDSTLTGRTQLWSLVLVAIGHHPILGFGYDSFWQGLQGSSLDIIRSVGWLVPTAHNGYLDLLLSVGFVGAVLMVLPLSLAAYRGFQYLQSTRSSTRFLPLVFLAFWLVYNLNESALLTRSGLPFLFFAALATAMRKSRTAYPTQPAFIPRPNPVAWPLRPVIPSNAGDPSRMFLLEV